MNGFLNEEIGGAPHYVNSSEGKYDKKERRFLIFQLKI